jgi:ubiquinol-cytochrome c reductase cytochrome b subunit
MIVILNLVTIVPVVSDAILESLLAGTSVSSLSIRRFLVLHFALALVSTGLVLVHIILIHRGAPSTSGHLANDGSQAIVAVLVKDTIFVSVAFIGCFSVLLWDLIHPDNWNSYDMLATPEHIEPEIYFLWTFSILKLHNGKLVGALLQPLTLLSYLSLSS